MTKFSKEQSNYNESKFIGDKPQEDMPSLSRLMKKNQMTKILDHGCGSGRNIVYLAKQGMTVSGLDLSDLCLSNTKEWLDLEGLNADLKKSDFFKKLSYNDGWFDAVISIRALSHNKKNSIKKAIMEIYRVLKHGGYFYLQTAKMTTDVESQFQTKFKKLTNNTYLQLEGHQKGTIHYLFSEDSIREILQNFRILDIHTDKSQQLYSILAQKP